MGGKKKDKPVQDVSATQPIATEGGTSTAPATSRPLENSFQGVHATLLCLDKAERRMVQDMMWELCVEPGFSAAPRLDRKSRTPWGLVTASVLRSTVARCGRRGPK
ncbi:hypothetical protein WJX73_009021 [Symbiochloris irregularis]|uniref:Uncharacterized protein n=1 Tax=Symbiochloris irregularis TaxID=706552 RepID=A0AAW1PRP2_9CHLO